VGIKQQSQSFSTSHLPSSAGDMILPVIFMRSFIQPSHESDLGGGGGGVTSAIGSPLRVTMIDFPIFLTLSNKHEHLALNFEMGIFSCTSVLHTFKILFVLHHIQ
jgi:hypothetical protein